MSKTYAHMVSKPRITFTPVLGRAHLGPWKSLKTFLFGMPAGWKRDVLAVLFVSGQSAMPGHDIDEISAWIMQLLSFQIGSYLAVAYYEEEPGDLRTFTEEFLPRQHIEASTEHLDWVKANWRESLPLISDPAVQFALETFFLHHLIQSDEMRIVSAWTVLERIFSSKGAELRFRVSANLAAYLEPRGPLRQQFFRSTLRLYDERSSAAHGSPLRSSDACASTMRLVRRALTKIIEQRHVPSPEELEMLLFG